MFYHSNELAFLYLVFGLSFVLVFNQSFKFTEISLLIFSMPLLGSYNTFGFFIPLEFIIVPLVPLLLGGESVLIVILSGLFYSVVKIINLQEYVGYVLIDLPDFSFYNLTSYPILFYDLSWMMDKFHPIVDLIKLKDILLNICKVFLNNSTLILQMTFWGVSTYVIKYFQGLKKQFSFVLGYLISLFLMFFLYFLIALLNPQKLEYSLISFCFSLTVIYSIICGMALLKKYSIFDLYNKFVAKYKQKKKEENEMFQKSLFSDAPLEPSSEIIQEKKQEEHKEELTIDNLSLDKLSLEEAVQLSVRLNEYINDNFSVYQTFLGVDIFKSSKLKQDESEDAIQFSFEHFHQFVDKLVSAFGAKLLNRSGDGVLYSFEKADRAVFAGRAVLTRLKFFNQKISKLKTSLQVKLGINTGKVIRDKDADGGKTFSRALDLTGHLLKLAHQNQILIGEDTYNALEDKSFTRKVFFSEEDNIEVYTLKEEFIFKVSVLK
jgi:class 3 adenylate cyclase